MGAVLQGEVTHVARRRKLSLLATPIIVLLVVALAAGSFWAWHWWYREGAHLHGAGGGVGAPMGLAQTLHVGVELNSTGGVAELVSARAHRISPGLHATFEITDHPVGAIRGNLENEGYHVRGVRGATVNGNGPDDALVLAVAVTASKPGVYHLNDVDITYNAGPRTRHSRAELDLCVLVYAPASRRSVLSDINVPRDDPRRVHPLVAAYRQCGAF